MSDLFADAVEQVLKNQCTPAVVRAIEAGEPASVLWQHLEDAGFADALVPEAHGGAGLSLAEIFPIWALCGAYAVPVPLGETLLARAALVQAGVAVPRGSVTLAQGRMSPDGSLVCDAVPGGRVADWVVVAHGHANPSAHLLAVRSATACVNSFVLDASLSWPAAVAAAAPRLGSVPDVRLLYACLNAAQLSGALMTVFNRTLQYANERIQFGRPIGKFQAIQHQLSVISEHAFAARMAAQMGCSSTTDQPDRLQVAIAKARTSEAALEVAALSHSIHGAIGFTQEFDLQLFTRRLHHWRQVGGAESYWHAVVGAALVDHHAGLSLDLIRRATDVPARTSADAV